MNDPHSLAVREALSPGLHMSNGDRAPAYELKFLLPEAHAPRVEDWAATHLVPDPHAEPRLGNAYRVTSLYLDTPRLDVFHRCPPNQRRKLRLRGYCSSAALFLEQKTRRGDRVRKRRTPICETELLRFRDPPHPPSLSHDETAPEGNGQDWCGAWFQKRSIARGLRPTFQIGCVRSAFLGTGTEGPIRITLDRHIWGVPNHDWRLLMGQGGLPLLDGQVVLELKYRSAMPALFKRLLEEMPLTPCPVSKYRLAVRAWNAGGEVHPVG
ncbi:MAG: polyphosphate polymerase domain-containing protein [Planctomycetes bacterium]|nr:polyphosphate polymerase domain-containing protein [Planctomycetota bacterium]